MSILQRLSVIVDDVMDKDPSQWQVILNLAFGLVSFFTGWMLKVIFGLIVKVREENEHSVTKVQDDYRRLAEQVTNLAISLPQNYVSKEDHNNLIKSVHHRFDRLEEKIDALREHK